MSNLLFQITKNPLAEDTILIMSNETHTYSLKCNAQPWCFPFPGKKLSNEEIKELIEFLQQTLEE